MYLLEFRCDYKKIGCTLVGFLRFPYKIDFIGFIAESMVMILDNENKIYFVNTREFKDIKHLNSMYSESNGKSVSTAVNANGNGSS